MRIVVFFSLLLSLPLMAKGLHLEVANMSSERLYIELTGAGGKYIPGKLANGDYHITSVNYTDGSRTSSQGTFSQGASSQGTYTFSPKIFSKGCYKYKNGTFCQFDPHRFHGLYVDSSSCRLEEGVLEGNYKLWCE
jgi:hypothetical protein